MTLIAGFCGHGGVILCSDSLETTADYSKKYVHKIVDTEGPGFRFACAGSGNGPYVDMVIERILLELGSRQNVDMIEASALLQRILSEHYSIHVWPRPADGKADIELLAVISRDGHTPMLLHTSETAVNRIEDYRAIGIGRYLADYLLEHLLSRHGAKYHMLAVAAYVLKKARDYIEGCGGESHLYFFPVEGGMTWIWPHEFTALEGVLERFDQSLKEAFHSVTDIGSRTRKADWPTVCMSNFYMVEDAMRELTCKLDMDATRRLLDFKGSGDLLGS